ncbi:MAG: AarF/ABC1/UbiB kinase family protein [bacterium]|nr:AarF/ABC1/UbiB kinase family protein [bacterium]
MKISSIPQIYRNVQRWAEIISVLSKYGLADWIARLNLDIVKDQLRDPDGEILARQSPESRIRLAMQELGPTFIKLGQLLSTRPDVVGVALAKELQKLQSSVRADSYEEVQKIVESELGLPIGEIFAEFDETPIASASIGQVHRARLSGGEEVVVKVQHVGIEKRVGDDLELLSGIAVLAERIDEFRRYNPVQMVAEMSRSLRRELDFGREERNLHQFEATFADDPTVRIPKPFTELCTARVLTMEKLEGMKLKDRARLIAAGVDTEELARRGAGLYMTMIFKHGFFHADPHPGNILVLPGNVIGLLDFGMVGRINERLREDIEEMLISIVNQDTPMLSSIIKRVGQMPPSLDEGVLANDLADFVGQYSGQSLERFDLAGALNDMTEIMRQHQITLPSEAALLMKTLVTLDGTAKMLSPQFSLMEVMRPMHSSLLMRRFSPMRQVRKVRRLMFHLEQLAEVLPQRVVSILDQVQSGRFDVHLDHRRLGPSVNRLVLGMMTSALFLGAALMLANNVPPQLFPNEPWYLGLHRISILGLCCVILSFLMGLRLLWAIRSSGNLDKND